MLNMKTRSFILIILFCLCHNVVASGQSINMCDDVEEWPPYLFYERGGMQVNKEELHGGMIDILNEISKITGFNFTIKLLPWKRCLQEVKQFAKLARYEMGVQMSVNEERLKDYYLIGPIYFSEPGYWYSKNKYPNGLIIDEVADLRKYKAIGVLGYNYSFWGYINNQGIDTGAHDTENAFKKLALGRGDVFLSDAATPYGYEAIFGKSMIPQGIVFSRITNADRGTGFFMFVSKDSPRALELVTKINQAIIILNSRGIVDNILKRYLPCGKNC